ncbi:MAG: hypothetical protein P0S95_03185 [Rhabdochlamydiaceae bacterium]|nr:hypothetical protein [Candidatus Amphrikana amoebophyrae]
MKKILYSQFHEKLKALKQSANDAITEAKHDKTFNEGLVCHLANTISELEETAAQIISQVDDEDIKLDAQMVQNMIEQPITPKSQPHKKVSLLQAAKMQKELNDASEIKEVILACVLDEKKSNVMLSNLEQICDSIEDQLDELN